MQQLRKSLLCAAITTAGFGLISCGDEPEVKDTNNEGSTEQLVVNIDSNIAPSNQKAESITDARQATSDMTSAIAAPAENLESSITTAVDTMANLSIIDLLLSDDDEPVEIEAVNTTTSTDFAIESRISKTKWSRSDDQSMEETVSDLLDLSNATADLDTNIVTIGVNSENICETGDTDCFTTLDNVTLQVQVINSDAGLITVQYAGHSPFEFAYAPDFLAVLVDLAELKSAGIARDTELETEDYADAPAIFEGQFAVSIAASPNQSTIEASIEQTIKIGDASNSIEIASTSNLVTLALDSVLETMHMTSNVNAISGEITGDDNSVAEISFDGANFDLLIDGVNELVTITNSGLLGNGFSFTVDNEIVLNAMVDNFSAQYAEATQTTTFDTAFNTVVEMFVAQVEEYNDGVTVTSEQADFDFDLSVTMPSGTQVQSVEEDLVVQAQSVSVMIEATIANNCEYSWAVGDESSQTASCAEDVTETLSGTFTTGEVIGFE